MSVRSINLLLGLGDVTLNDVLKRSRYDLLMQPNCGAATVLDIECWIQSCGINVWDGAGRPHINELSRYSRREKEPYIDRVGLPKNGEPPTCGNCAHWVELETRNVNRGGACRRYPPKAGVPIETGSSILGGRPTEEFERWPTTRAHERCGEWTGIRTPS